MRGAARRQRGAALLTAMVIVTLVATLAGSMIWQQWRAVQVEAAERGRTQSQWILDGAIDWARLILREDLRSSNGANSGIDHLGEPWALPLAEAKLSTFLAADRENTDDAPDAFLSGAITDAQSRYNLRNLIDSGGSPEARLAEEQILQRLLDLAGAPPGGASVLVERLREAAQAVPGATQAAPGSAPAGVDAGAGAPDAGSAVGGPKTAIDEETPLLPQRLEQLTWLGLDTETVRRLAPFVTLLPVATKINVNTAPKEVLSAVLNIDLALAERFVQERQHQPFDPGNRPPVPQRDGSAPPPNYGYNSNYFFVRGRLRLQDRVVEESALVQRDQNKNVTVVRRERLNALESPGS